MGWRRNDFCFTVTERSYLVVGFFHDLLQSPRNDIYDTKLLGAPMCCGPRLKQKRCTLPLSELHPITRSA